MPTGVYQRTPCSSDCTCGKHQGYSRSPEHRELQAAKARERGFAHKPDCGCVWCGSNPASTRHGDTSRTARTPEYVAWSNMRGRCLNLDHPKFKDYGGRGITVCEGWDSYENFLADMGRRPGPDLSLDRIDNDGNYEPGNCRWATKSEQQSNRRCCA
jgi:hypothetical protein